MSGNIFKVNILGYKTSNLVKNKTLANIGWSSSSQLKTVSNYYKTTHTKHKGLLNEANELGLVSMNQPVTKDNSKY